MTEIIAGDYRTSVGDIVTTESSEPHVGVSRLRSLVSSAVAGVYAGIALVAIGFATLGYTWTQISLTVDVGLQLPYVISGGFVGLGLIMTGLLLLTVNARRQDAAERARQLERLIEVVEDLGERLDRLEG